jgi:hypothetical protein
MISLLLAGLIAAPSHYAQKPLTNRQVRAQAYQIVQLLKRQDPRVLRSVMYHMRWVPKLDYNRQQQERKKRQSDLDAINQWELNFLMNEAGIPNPRKNRQKK